MKEIEEDNESFTESEKIKNKAVNTKKVDNIPAEFVKKEFKKALNIAKPGKQIKFAAEESD